MTHILELTPEQEARLQAAARSQGASPDELLVRFVESLPTGETIPDAENAAAIALLRGYLEREATDDPEQIRHAEAELATFKRALNAERAANGERLLFP